MPLYALPLTKNSGYLEACWKECHQRGFAGAHFSHKLCHDAHDLLDDPAWAAEARTWVAELSSKALETWVWTHEFHRPPPHLINADNKLLFDQGDWAEPLDRKISRHRSRGAIGHHCAQGQPWVFLIEP